eukprot:XP_001610434.1 hypothetical protein [Babesia bovis T2Bo]
MSDTAGSVHNSPVSSSGTAAPSFGGGVESINDGPAGYTVSSPLMSTADIGMPTGISTAPLGNDLAGMNQLPTVYLPPIHYTYDRKTGQLVQVTEGNQGVNPGVAIPRTTVLNSNNVATSSPVPHSKSAPVTPTGNASPGSFISQGIPGQVSQQSRFVGVDVPASSGISGSSLQGSQFPVPPPSAPMVMPQGMLPTAPISTTGVSTPGVTTVGHTMTSGIYTNPVYPQVNYVAPPGGYPPMPQWQMPVGFVQPGVYGNPVGVQYREAPLPVNPTGATQAFANTFQRAYNGTARVLRGFDDMSSGDMMHGVQRMLNPAGAEFVKAAVFRLRRLEDVPIASGAMSRVAYSLVAYFDPATENYGVYHSHPRYPHQGTAGHLVNCDLDGEVVKIPWQGEPYVFVKIVEHVNQMETVVGRLKLHVESLVRDHPLRVNIISDRNNICGTVIFEFSVGHMSFEEMRDAQDKALRSATERRSMEYQYRSRNYPDYDASLRQRDQYARDSRASEYQRANPPYRGRSYTPATGEVSYYPMCNVFNV